MITWTPYPNLRLSAHVLSPHTLGRQITQALQLLRAATGASVGTSTLYSPAYDMWKETPSALMVYIDGLIRESELRGCSQGLPVPSSPEGRRVYDIPKTWRRETAQMPDWLGVEKLHASHRACLLTQDLEWYAQFAWDEPPRYDVFWQAECPRSETGSSLRTEGKPRWSAHSTSRDDQLSRMRLACWFLSSAGTFAPGGGSEASPTISEETRHDTVRVVRGHEAR